MREALRECERAWEKAYAASGELGLAFIAARQQRNLSIVAGHQILSGVGKASSLAGEGQSELANVHRLIEKLAAAVGVETMDDGNGYGDGWKPPS